MTMDPAHISILLDIKQEIGSLVARMDDAAASTLRLEEGQQGFRDSLQPVNILAASVSEMKPQVTELMEFKSRVSLYLWGASAFISGLLFFVWEGIKYALDKWFHH